MTETNDNKQQPKAADVENTQAAVSDNAAKEAKYAPAQFRAIMGRKVGMTQMFDDEGNLHAVTIIQAGPCQIVNIRTKERDGYQALCLGFSEIPTEELNKSLAGQFKGTGAFKHLKEYRVDKTDGFEVGQIVAVKDRFSAGDYVDVQGVTKGRGFAGGMKRHGFRGLPGSHGASDKERSPGSLASRRGLGRVIPGQRMAGRYGGETMTITKAAILKTDTDKNLVYLSGSAPGANGSLISILETTRKQKKVPSKASAPAGKKGAVNAAKKPSAAAGKK